MLKNKPILIIGVAIAVIVLGAIAWYLASPLFIDRPVDEAFPFEAPNPTAMAQMTVAEQATVVAEFEAALPNETEVAAMPTATRQAVEGKIMKAAALMPDKVMDEPMPGDAEPVDSAAQRPPAPIQPMALLQGQFNGVDRIHYATGGAIIYQLADGQRILRFENFNAANGPDLRVILSSNPTVHETRDLGEYVELGKLKGNTGNQNYDIAADLELSKYPVVVIYCKPFHVVFATATLTSVPQSQ